jgi:hypothetical protein
MDAKMLVCGGCVGIFGARRRQLCKAAPNSVLEVEMARARRGSVGGGVLSRMQHDDVPGRRCCTLWPLHSFCALTLHFHPHVSRASDSHCSTQHCSNTTMRPSSSLVRAFARASAPRPFKASPAEHIPAPAKRLLHTCPLRTSPAKRPSPVLSRVRALPACRFESSSAAPTPPNTSTKAPESRLDREQIPSYELTFTCNVCKTRSSHRMSKQGYHKGTILISCPDCKNRHLISDHLKVRRASRHGESQDTDFRRYSQTSPSQSKILCEKRAISSREAR